MREHAIRTPRSLGYRKMPVKRTGLATEQTFVSQAEPVPEKISITLNVQFDAGKAKIKPKYHSDIKRIADFMNTYPSTSALIEGHTDNVGKEVGNVKLSYRRAANMKAYLVALDQMDVVEFTDKNEREKLDNKEPRYATMPICTDNKAIRKTTRWYQDCLRSYAGSYNPENSLKAGKQTKVFEYDPISHNCCNFAEGAESLWTGALFLFGERRRP